MKSQKHGFTIIEVVLVLGIAGLIFMMAFIALPSLWASERDADRKATVMEFISSLKTYQTNNSRGALPVLNGNGPDVFTLSDARSSSTSSDWRDFIKNYVSADFSEPSGKDITFYVANCLGPSGGNLNVTAPCAYSTDFASVNANSFPGTGINYTLYVAIGAVCDGDQAVKSSSSRDVAAVYVLERSGRYCYGT